MIGGFVIRGSGVVAAATEGACVSATGSSVLSTVEIRTVLTSSGAAAGAVGVGPVTTVKAVRTSVVLATTPTTVSVMVPSSSGGTAVGPGNRGHTWLHIQAFFFFSQVLCSGDSNLNLVNYKKKILA